MLSSFLVGRSLMTLTATLLIASPAWPQDTPRAAPVYRCVLDGIATYSDRPCGAAAEPYQPDTSRISTYSAPPADPGLSKVRARINRAPRRAAPTQAVRRAEQCARIATALKDLRSRMRAGYRASEADRLNAREDRLKERWRQSRCR